MKGQNKLQESISAGILRFLGKPLNVAVVMLHALRGTHARADGSLTRRTKLMLRDQNRKLRMALTVD